MIKRDKRKSTVKKKKHKDEDKEDKLVRWSDLASTVAFEYIIGGAR